LEMALKCQRTGYPMAHEDLRVASSVLALRSFSLQQLCRMAEVNRNTAGSWLRRHRTLFEEVPAIGAESKGRGRPYKTWRLRHGCDGELRKVLDILHRGTDQAGATGTPPHILDRIEAQLEAWQVSCRFGSESSEQESVALRALVRIAWENLADHHAASGEISASVIKRLAELECAAGLGELPTTNRLPEVAAWIADRMERMLRRSVRDEFAGRVLRARAETRRLADRVKLTAAALAAPVWSDEGVIPQRAETLRRCVVAANVVPVAECLAELEFAIDIRPARGYCIDEQETQAVVLGLATRPGANYSNEIRGWLAALHLSNDWLPEMAPAVLQGLAEARGIRWMSLVASLKEPLQIALERQKNWGQLGALRRQALEFGLRVLDAPLMNTPRHATNVEGSDIAEGGAWAADVIPSGFFAYRPRQASAQPLLDSIERGAS
jgi:hypothetical protein